jgi:hypothetical protein
MAVPQICLYATPHVIYIKICNEIRLRWLVNTISGKGDESFLAY